MQPCGLRTQGPFVTDPAQSQNHQIARAILGEGVEQGLRGHHHPHEEVRWRFPA